MKVFVSLLFVMTLLLFFTPPICAAETDTDAHLYDYEQNVELSESLGFESLFDSLPEEVKESMSKIGINSISADEVGSITFDKLTNRIFDIAKEESKSALSSIGVIAAALLLYALVEGFIVSVTTQSMREVLSVVCSLCIAGVLVLPVTETIDAANKAIKTSSDFMLAFIPIMLAVLISCGKALSGSGYYSLMIFTAEGIAQLSSKIISPMLNVFLGVSLCSAVVPDLKLGSLTEMFSKTIKWILSFSFTIFSALLTFRTLIATSIDSVSTRAVRFTMSSFIPVVGAALSEAYKTVQGSVNVLKNGLGVFVILAVSIVFLPIVLRLLLWNFTLSLCKTISEMLNVTIPAGVLKSLSTVLSVLLAVVLCVMALFTISTALIITAGGFQA